MDALECVKLKWKSHFADGQVLDCTVGFKTAKKNLRILSSNAQENGGGHVLAIDVGTGGTKAALISSSGLVISSAFAPHRAPAPSPAKWQVTSVMQFFIQMRVQVWKQLSILAKLRWLDKHDMSAATQCESLLFGGHDYVSWKLSGAVVTDATTASTTGLTDLSFEYAESLIHRANLGHWMEMLPNIAPVDAPCGEVSESAALELGFPFLKEVPVFHCCGDAGACSLGAGAGVPGSMYAYLGTSGWVAGSFRRGRENMMRSIPGVYTLAHPDSTLIFKTGSVMTAGGNLAWAASNLVYTAKRDSLAMREIDKLAKLAQIGSGGLLYLPFLSGERCPFDDPTARASFIGISSSTNSEDMFRSIMEGVSFAMRSARDAMLYESLTSIGPLRLVGGGASSPLWPQIIANVFGQDVEVLEDAQDVGVKGAALLAGKWLGWHDTLSPSGNWIKVKRSYQPSQKDALAYDYLFTTYTEAYNSLKPIFEKLSLYWK